MQKKESRKCSVCGGDFKTIGLERKNGKGSYRDWETRSCHKKCLKDYMLMERMNKMYSKTPEIIKT
jgi:hypothetical protein